MNSVGPKGSMKGTTGNVDNSEVHKSDLSFPKFYSTRVALNTAGHLKLTQVFYRNEVVQSFLY